MPFCTKCGKELDENAKFCNSCGTAVDSAAQEPQNNSAQGNNQQQNFSQQPEPQANPQQSQQNPQQNQQAQYNQNPQQNQNYYQGVDGTYVYTGPVNEDGMYVSDVEKNKYLNILSYLGILFLIPYFCAKGSKYTRFHVNQGIILLICDVAYVVAKEIILAILRACLFNGWESYLYSFSPAYGLYSIISIILNIASLAFLALAIYGIYNTCTGKAKELPVIGKFRILK